VDVLVGCFSMIRRETFNDVGLLDENLFMYGDDVDWCRCSQSLEPHAYLFQSLKVCGSFWAWNQQTLPSRDLPVGLRPSSNKKGEYEFAK
jgi:hypothetical protein